MNRFKIRLETCLNNAINPDSSDQLILRLDEQLQTQIDRFKIYDSRDLNRLKQRFRKIFNRYTGKLQNLNVLRKNINAVIVDELAKNMNTMTANKPFTGICWYHTHYPSARRDCYGDGGTCVICRQQFCEAHYHHTHNDVIRYVRKCSWGPCNEYKDLYYGRCKYHGDRLRFPGN